MNEFKPTDRLTTFFAGVILINVLAVFVGLVLVVIDFSLWRVPTLAIISLLFNWGLFAMMIAHNLTKKSLDKSK